MVAICATGAIHPALLMPHAHLFDHGAPPGRIGTTATRRPAPAPQPARALLAPMCAAAQTRRVSMANCPGAARPRRSGAAMPGTQARAGPMSCTVGAGQPDHCSPGLPHRRQESPGKPAPCAGLLCVLRTSHASGFHVRGAVMARRRSRHFQIRQFLGFPAETSPTSTRSSGQMNPSLIRKPRHGRPRRAAALVSGARAG
jgi:hypothetical protein